MQGTQRKEVISLQDKIESIEKQFHKASQLTGIIFVAYEKSCPGAFRQGVMDEVIGKIVAGKRWYVLSNRTNLLVRIEWF